MSRTAGSVRLVLLSAGPSQLAARSSHVVAPRASRESLDVLALATRRSLVFVAGTTRLSMSTPAICPAADDAPVTARLATARAPCSVRRLQPGAADAEALSVILRANECEWAPFAGGTVELLRDGPARYARERVLATLREGSGWIVEAPVQAPVGFLLLGGDGSVRAAGLLQFWRDVGLEEELARAAGVEVQSLRALLPVAERIGRDAYSIRRATATPDDAARLGRVSETAFLESFADDHDFEAMKDFFAQVYSPEAYLSDLASPKYSFWIVECRSLPVGYAMVGPASSDDSFDALGQPGDSLLKRIYLLAPHIGTGQGRLLLDLAKRDAIERRSSRLLLSVYPPNLVAKTFYERQGFVRIGEYTFKMGAIDMTDFAYALDLTETRPATGR